MIRCPVVLGPDNSNNVPGSAVPMPTRALLKSSVIRLVPAKSLNLVVPPPWILWMPSLNAVLLLFEIIRLAAEDPVFVVLILATTADEPPSTSSLLLGVAVPMPTLPEKKPSFHRLALMPTL